MGLPDHEVDGDDLGDGVDPGVWRDLVAAVDGGSWLVVPDEGVPVVMVADGRGRRYPTVAGVTPGADLADALERLTTAAGASGGVTGSGFPSGVSLSGVGDVELGEVVGACQRLGSWARAVQAVVVGELSRRESMQPLASARGFVSVSAQACTALELTGVLRLTSGQARNLVAESLELVEVFPATHAALAAGVVDERRARVILAELRGHERRVAHLVEAAVLAQAGGLNPVQLRRKIKALLLRLAPVGSEQRHQRAREGRYVRLTPGEDGMTYLDGLLPAEDAAALKAVLEAGQQALKHRDTTTGDPRARTADQRRADTLAQLAWTALTHARLTPATNTTGTAPRSVDSSGQAARARVLAA